MWNEVGAHVRDVAASHVRIKQGAAGGVRVKAEVNISAAAVSTPLWAVLRCDTAQKRSQTNKQKIKTR